jgi:hypothetical protein
MTTGAYAWTVVLAFSGIAHVSAAQPGAAPTLRSVQTAVEGGVTIVTIVADGPLPAPASGVAEKPPARLFFDLIGVNPLPGGHVGRMIRLPGAGAVSRVRVARFSASPNVTRVVLDLNRLEPFDVNVGDQVAGRIRIAVGSPAATTPPAPVAPNPAPATVTSPGVLPNTTPPPAELLPKAPPPATSPPTAVISPRPPPPPLAEQRQPVPAEPVPSLPSPTRRGIPQQETAFAHLPPGAVGVYRRQLSDSIERFESHRVVIGGIDMERHVTVQTLEAVGAELKSLQAKLQPLKPSAELRPTHDLLLASIALGVNAVGLRLEAERRDDATGRHNAASAAAGALMLFDRACVVLGCALRQ